MPELMFDEMVRQGGEQAIDAIDRFFRSKSPVPLMRALARAFGREGIHYVVSGGLALVVQGCYHSTTELELLLLPEQQSRAESLIFQLRESLGRQIVVTCDQAGQPVVAGSTTVFPHPGEVAVSIEGVRYMRLPTLISLRLLRGSTSGLLLRYIVDVVEAIKKLELPRQFAGELLPQVRQQYEELWDCLEASPKVED